MPEAASSQPSAASTEATGAGGRGRRRRKNGASRSLSPAPPGAPETSTSPAGTGKASTSNSRAPTPPRAQSPSPQAKLLWDGFPDEFADYPNGQREFNIWTRVTCHADPSKTCVWVESEDKGSGKAHSSAPEQNNGPVFSLHMPRLLSHPRCSALKLDPAHMTIEDLHALRKIVNDIFPPRYNNKKEADKKKKKGKAKPSTEEVPKDEEKKDTKQERHESEAKHKSVSNKEHRDVGWALLKKWYPRLKHAYGALPQELESDGRFYLDQLGNVVALDAAEGSLCCFNSDHIFNWNRGGYSIDCNLMPLAARANKSKSDEFWPFIIRWCHPHTNTPTPTTPSPHHSATSSPPTHAPSTSTHLNTALVHGPLPERVVGNYLLLSPTKDRSYLSVKPVNQGITLESFNSVWQLIKSSTAAQGASLEAQKRLLDVLYLVPWPKMTERYDGTGEAVMFDLARDPVKLAVRLYQAASKLTSHISMIECIAPIKTTQDTTNPTNPSKPSTPITHSTHGGEASASPSSDSFPGSILDTDGDADDIESDSDSSCSPSSSSSSSSTTSSSSRTNKSQPYSYPAVSDPQALSNWFTALDTHLQGFSSANPLRSATLAKAQDGGLVASEGTEQLLAQFGYLISAMQQQGQQGPGAQALRTLRDAERMLAGLVAGARMQPRHGPAPKSHAETVNRDHMLESYTATWDRLWLPPKRPWATHMGKSTQGALTTERLVTPMRYRHQSMRATGVCMDTYKPAEALKTRAMQHGPCSTPTQSGFRVSGHESSSYVGIMVPAVPGVIHPHPPVDNSHVRIMVPAAIDAHPPTDSTSSLVTRAVPAIPAIDSTTATVVSPARPWRPRRVECVAQVTSIEQGPAICSLSQSQQCTQPEPQPCHSMVAAYRSLARPGALRSPLSAAFVGPRVAKDQ